MLGLRRGFQQAGAQNLLLCIWPIQDTQACEFMEAFYGKIGAGADPRQAYTKTISESLVRTKKALGLAEAIRSAGAFVLSSSASTPFKRPEIVSAKTLAGKKK